jgi:hypothetical protein
MSTKLHQIKQDQVNIGLTDENYVEKAKRYLDSLDEFCCEAETGKYFNLALYVITIEVM